jgi:hypothetical protein
VAYHDFDDEILGFGRVQPIAMDEVPHSMARETGGKGRLDEEEVG